MTPYTHRDRIGTIIGTGIGGMETLHNLYKGLFEKGPSRVNPFVVPKMIANMASGQVSITLAYKAIVPVSLRLALPERTLSAMHSA